MTSIAVIIPVKNDARRLGGCLQAIANDSTRNAVAELIVADNGSTDDSPVVARAAGARVLSLPGLRVSELRNAAASTTNVDLIAFIDADHEIANSWIGAAVDVMKSDDVGAAGAVYSPPEHGTWVQEAYAALRGSTTGRSDVPWLGSGNLVVRRAAFLQIGGFDASLDACEDVDFCRRLSGAGWRIVADERLRSVHLGDPATLAALFRAERWRGRDNLRVSLRGPLRLRDIPSIATPILTLMALVLLIAGLMAAARAGSALWIASAGAISMLVLAGLRTVRMVTRARGARLTFFARALTVALTYDLARGLALVSRAPHHRRTRRA